MTDINKVIIRGRAAADASVKHLTNSALVTLRVVTDGSYKGKDGRMVERVDWHNVACSQLRTRSYGEGTAALNRQACSSSNFDTLSDGGIVHAASISFESG